MCNWALVRVSRYLANFRGLQATVELGAEFNMAKHHLHHIWGVSNPIDTVKLGYGDGEKWGLMGKNGVI